MDLPGTVDDPQDISLRILCGHVISGECGAVAVGELVNVEEAFAHVRESN